VIFLVGFKRFGPDFDHRTVTPHVIVLSRSARGSTTIFRIHNENERLALAEGALLYSMALNCGYSFRKARRPASYKVT
jgi:hypothetical protein